MILLKQKPILTNRRNGGGVTPPPFLPPLTNLTTPFCQYNFIDSKFKYVNIHDCLSIFVTHPGIINFITFHKLCLNSVVDLHAILIKKKGVPPLRERKDDIPLLVSGFINNFNEEKGYMNPSPLSRQKY